MKKKIIISAIIVAVVAAIVALVVVLTSVLAPETDLSGFKSANGMFSTDTVNVNCAIKEADFAELQKMFSGKKLYSGSPSCSFGEECSIIFGGTDVFCIAKDDCGIIYYQNEDKYFDLSDVESARLREILKPYGFYWPCV